MAPSTWSPTAKPPPCCCEIWPSPDRNGRKCCRSCKEWLRSAAAIAKWIGDGAVDVESDSKAASMLLRNLAFTRSEWAKVLPFLQGMAPKRRGDSEVDWRWRRRRGVRQQSRLHAAAKSGLHQIGMGESAAVLARNGSEAPRR